MGGWGRNGPHELLSLALLSGACVKGLCPQPSSGARLGTEPTAPCHLALAQSLHSQAGCRESGRPLRVKPGPADRATERGRSVLRLMQRQWGRSGPVGDQAHPRERTQCPQLLRVTWRDGSRTVPVVSLSLSPLGSIPECVCTHLCTHVHTCVRGVCRARTRVCNWEAQAQGLAGYC